MDRTQAHLAARSGQHGPARRSNDATTLVATALAMVFGRGGGQSPQRQRTHVPRMVCSPPEVIAAWNRAVAATDDRGSRIAKKRIDRNLKRAFKGDGQAPKFAKPRVHKPHQHPLHDKHGAYTLTGGAYTVEGKGVRPTSREHVLGGVFTGPDMDEHSEYTARRVWLAGISAQRGY